MKISKKTTKEEMKKTRRDIVLIHWWDAVSDSGWNDERGISELVTKNEEHLVWSAGVIVKSDRDFYYLAGDWGMGDNPFNRVILIPKGMVKTKRIIRRWRK